MFISTPLKATLEDSISSGTFVDTKFWVFSHLNRETGRLERPMAVFSNSTVVRSVPYLSALLDKVPEGPLDTDFPQTTEEPLLGEYEYQSDPDLSHGITQSTPPTPSSTSGQGQIAEGCGLLHPRLGRTIIIRDAAFVTFRAVLLYLYVKKIAFGTSNLVGARSNLSSGVPLPSAKSVYRLADKYGIRDLAEISLLEIKSGVKKCNIIEESFDKFVSWYPEVRDLYVYRLAQAMRSSDPPGISAALDAKMEEYFTGKLPHAGGLVFRLSDLLENDRMSPHPSPTGSSHSTVTLCSDVNHGSWVRMARSLTTGIFLDSILYVEDSTELHPLFFCSSIAPASFKKITEIGKLVSMGSLYGSSERATPRGGSPIASQDAIDQNVLVVSSGDFRTWKSIISYIYTGRISFAPFGSSGLAPVPSSSTNPGVSNDGVDMKLVYELAKKIELDPLRDVAYQSIKLSMTSENIVEELFSTFSAEHEPIREMQYQLLRQKFWTADTQQGLRTKLEQSNDQVSHYGPAMAAVFRDIIQGEQTEGTARAITRSSFHTEPDPSSPNIIWKFQTITAAPAYRNMSQEELRLTHQQNPRTGLEVHPSNFPLNSPTGANGSTPLLR